MGAPSKLRLGGISQPPTRHFQPTTKMGAPSKLRLGGIAQTLNPPLPTHLKNGCPIQASLGWDSTNPQPATSNPPQKWVPHPSFAWVGYHNPQPATSNPPQKWAPSKLRLGGISQPPTRHFQPTTKMGAHPASLRWDSTNHKRTGPQILTPRIREHRRDIVI